MLENNCAKYALVILLFFFSSVNSLFLVFTLENEIFLLTSEWICVWMLLQIENEISQLLKQKFANFSRRKSKIHSSETSWIFHALWFYSIFITNSTRFGREKNAELLWIRNFFDRTKNMRWGSFILSSRMPLQSKVCALIVREAAEC